MGSISRHIMPLVINSLGADTHTNTHTNVRGQSNSKKPGTRRPAHAWFKKVHNIITSAQNAGKVFNHSNTHEVLQ